MLLQVADDAIDCLLLGGTEARSCCPEICAQQDGIGHLQRDASAHLARQQYRLTPIRDRLTNAEMGLIRRLSVQDTDDHPEVGLGDEAVDHRLEGSPVRHPHATLRDPCRIRSSPQSHVLGRYASLTARHECSGDRRSQVAESIVSPITRSCDA